jgi:hypothetical protein
MLMLLLLDECGPGMLARGLPVYDGMRGGSPIGRAGELGEKLKGDEDWSGPGAVCAGL